jgi:hypothetical protein
MEVYKAIADVAGELAESGISKSSKNQQQGFMFRGIDAVYNTLAPLLAKHKLVILPRCIERECVERTTAKGGVLFSVTIKAEFDMVSALDGSKHTIATYGEAMDSGDKATNKAMSAAYKYAAFQAFCIPTEETAHDADAETHQVQPRPKATRQSVPVQTITDPAIIATYVSALEACTTLDGLKTAFGAAWTATHSPEVKATYDKLKAIMEAAQ